jgi:hypothetical protein
MFRQLIFVCFLLFWWQTALAGKTSNGDVLPEVVDDPAGEAALLDDTESQECAEEVVADLTDEKPPEIVETMAEILAKALKEECQCDAYAVRAMIEVGVPFALAFDSIAQTCELEGTELGDLSRSLAPAFGGNIDGGPGGGPGGGVSP